MSTCSDGCARLPRAARRTAAPVLLAALLATFAPGRLSAQDLGGTARLAGAGPFAPRAAVEWDEQITTTAGGATGDQFQQALIQTFGPALEASAVPVDGNAPVLAVCRVQTYYDRGQIAYAVRVEVHEPVGRDGAPAITWQRGWVGTTQVGGLHQMFTIGKQCAADLEEDWLAANPG